MSTLYKKGEVYFNWKKKRKRMNISLLYAHVVVKTLNGWFHVPNTAQKCTKRRGVRAARAILLF